jgi:hypothetical protein
VAAELVRQLGSDDFAEREAAARKLAELGAAAVEELRAGAKSGNPEIARRSQDLLRAAERRATNEKVLAPTLVELDAKNLSLDGVLAELSKQANCDVVLGGVKPEDVARKKIAISTGGKVPFWEAVLKVCDAADLQVAVAGGFLAPGAMPYLGRAPRGVRIAADRDRAVVLESRDGARRRPSAVRGAVLVEAVPFPKNTVPGQPSVLLQVWPEPRLRWEGTTNTKLAKATGAGGAKLAWEYVPPDAPDVRRTADGVVMVRNPDGTASFVRDTGGAFQLPGGFKPNARQAVVRFKNAQNVPAAKELTVSLVATVRTDPEQLCQVRGLALNKTATAGGPGGSELAVTLRPDGGGGFTAGVEVSYDPLDVQPIGVGDDLPDGVAGAAGLGNGTVHGVRFTDAAGKPYVLGLSTGLTRRHPAGRRTALILQLTVDAGKGKLGPPADATLWGSYLKPVDVGVTLEDVPLSGGK